jgi:hypothetical protein
MASSWESWVRFHALAVRAGGFGKECMGVSSRTLGKESFGRASSRRVCRIEGLVDVPRVSRSVLSRRGDLRTVNQNSSFHLTVAVDRECASDGHPAPALQTRPREEAFDSGLGSRTTHDSDCLQCSSHEVALVGPMISDAVTRGFLGPGSFTLARRIHPVAIDRESRDTLGRLRGPKPRMRHLCHQLKTLRALAESILASKTWKPGFGRARHLSVLVLRERDDVIRKQCHRPW